MNHRATALAITFSLSIFAQASHAAGDHAGGHDEFAIGGPGKAVNVSRTVQESFPIQV